MSARSIRRSQAVVPFGVGAIVEFEDEALMSAGQEAWPAEAERIRDERLGRRLGVDHFRVPPPKPDRGGVAGTMAPMPYVRFPQWHFCPRCRFLKKAELYAVRVPKCDNGERSQRLGNRPVCASLPERRRPNMVPLRFIAVCEAGHIEDFPWNGWVHTKAGEEVDRGRGCKPETLYFYATKQGGLSGLLISCSKCGAKRSLLGATNAGGLKGLLCKGERPWLGQDATEVCVAPQSGTSAPPMVALQRGASNLYFPEVASSILIPPFSSRLYRIVREPTVWDTLVQAQRPDGSIPEDVLRTVAALKKVDAEQLTAAFQSLNEGEAEDIDAGSDETHFRHAEYRALHQERRDQDDLLACRPQPLAKYGSIVRNHFEHVTLVERLAETRALTGFFRIKPGGTSVAALSRTPMNWLPAFRVHGEGVFIALREERLERWLSGGQEHTARLVERARARRPLLIVSPEMILLHTLAHLLIKRLSYEAGYGASSIRERIYSAPAGHPQRMAGLLLYTAAGDADGTLGGLVTLGRPGMLERVIEGALEEAAWCAADPICMESNGQGPDSLNLAGCHACSLLPETSCELQNRLLDRKSLLAFFD